MKADNNTLETLEQFEYFGTVLTNQNSTQKEIKNKLQSRNACYHSVQNLLPSIKLSKNIKPKIYRMIIFAVIMYVCAT